MKGLEARYGGRLASDFFVRVGAGSRRFDSYPEYCPNQTLE